MKHVFIIGSKGLPAAYGGFETFVQELVTRRQSDNLVYHVSCCEPQTTIKKKKTVERQWRGVDCFHIPIWDIGSGKAVIYDLKALRYCTDYIQKNRISDAVVYVLACRIGPFIRHDRKKLEALGVPLFVNPDGHEWKRGKWNFLIKKYWKISEKGMVRNANLVICDSLAIQAYINEKYSRYQPHTCFIPYGADYFDTEEKKSKVMQKAGLKAGKWMANNGVEPGKYYLVVGRFVPENNYECILREFMRCKTDKRLLIITSMDRKEFIDELQEKTGFRKDSRICFGGSLYDRDVLTIIRMQAFAYIHGHSVGGTNPSLLEAMGTTDVNLLYDVPYNREVGQDAALYWKSGEGSLQKLMDQVEAYNESQKSTIGMSAKKRIKDHYSWQQIVAEYEHLFLDN